MKARFLLLLLPMFLFGAGCAQKPQLPADWPTAEQLSSMTPGQLQAAMETFMQKHPTQPLSADEAAAETKRAHDLVLHHQIEEVAQFVDNDYASQGTARIVRDGDREYLVLSDDFALDKGPYLTVYLNDSLDPISLGKGAMSLGTLKTNNGGQVYDIRPGTDVSKFRSVLIYDQVFHVSFGYATFK